MGKNRVLKNKTCPKCGEPDALVICATVGAVNCSCCFSFIRLLTKDEIRAREKNIYDGITPEDIIRMKQENEEE